MARHTARHLVSAAAVLVLSALLVWFYPRNTRAVLTAGRARADLHALAISAGGQYRSCSVTSEQELLSALENSSCVRLPGLREGLSSGDICLFFGGMRAVFTPTGAYLYTDGARRASYLIVGAGAELYRQVRDLVAIHA